MMERLTSRETFVLLRRVSTHGQTRQDGQINYLSTLTIFTKQTTYLATLPNPSCFSLNQNRRSFISWHSDKTHSTLPARCQHSPPYNNGVESCLLTRPARRLRKHSPHLTSF